MAAAAAPDAAADSVRVWKDALAPNAWSACGQSSVATVRAPKVAAAHLQDPLTCVAVLPARTARRCRSAEATAPLRPTWQPGVQALAASRSARSPSSATAGCDGGNDGAWVTWSLTRTATGEAAFGCSSSVGTTSMLVSSPPNCTGHAVQLCRRTCAARPLHAATASARKSIFRYLGWPSSSSTALRRSTAACLALPALDRHQLVAEQTSPL